MGKFIWEIDFLPYYLKFQNKDAQLLLNEIEKNCQHIREILEITQHEFNQLKEILHLERICNELLYLLAEDPIFEKYYANVNECMKDLSNNEYEIKKYLHSIPFLKEDVKWLLLVAIGWSEEDKKSSISFGK